jgi:hypothetical protein
VAISPYAGSTVSRWHFKLTIVQYGQLRGEVRADIALENLARYVGVLYVSLLFSEAEQSTPAEYAVEVNTLLAFLRTALSP